MRIRIIHTLDFPENISYSILALTLVRHFQCVIFSCILVYNRLDMTNQKIREQIVMDSTIRFGKPTIRNTRITVEEVLGAIGSGMNFDEIQKEYGLKKNQILAAVNYTTGWIKGEVIKEYEVSAGR